MTVKANSKMGLTGKVVCQLTGSVDSAVAALILKRKGKVTMRIEFFRPHSHRLSTTVS